MFIRRHPFASLDFKDYPSVSEPGMLDGLMYENYEYILAQSFSFMSKYDAKKFLDHQRKQLENAQDAATSQIDEMYEALDQLISGEFNMGEYHSSMMIFGSDIRELNGNVASARAGLQDQGFLTAKVDLSLEALYWAQLPGNWRYRPRIARLTSRNFAGLNSYHNFASGKRITTMGPGCYPPENAEWTTLLFQPFHRTEEDWRTKRYAPRIIRQSGSGKTVLLSMLLPVAKYKLCFL